MVKSFSALPSETWQRVLPRGFTVFRGKGAC